MPDSCILWERGVSDTGYGQSWYDGKTISAHRLAYIAAFGSIPPGLSVLHRCDTKLCVNPKHLYLGTAKDNARDAVERGQIATGQRHGSKTKPERICRGSRKPNAKLTAEQVQEIRDIYKPRPTLDELAERYGVTRSAISRIVRGESYADALIAELNKDSVVNEADPVNPSAC
jgi:hypothetical protein